MAAGDKNDDEAAAAALLTQRRREGCPGCKIEEKCKAEAGIPYLNFFYIWVVCLCAFDASCIQNEELRTNYN
uniref:Uncharacterized protein n=1 Tax=Leersia perrieri TaxID=77586 RepID=A0A0D9UZP9_9ORYZ